MDIFNSLTYHNNMYTRIVEQTLRSLVPSPEIMELYNPRRVGKTTLLQLFFHELQKNHPAAFYSLDDPTTQSIFGEPSTARLESRGLPSFGFSDSGGSRGSMTCQSSSLTNCFAMPQSYQPLGFC